MPLLVYPALASLTSSLQHHRITLHATREVIPRHRHETIFALEVCVLFLECGLDVLRLVQATNTPYLLPIVGFPRSNLLLSPF